VLAALLTGPTPADVAADPEVDVVIPVEPPADAADAAPESST